MSYPEVNFETPIKDCPDCEDGQHSECCGAPMNEDFKVCQKCKEHCDFADCETCKGAGFLELTEEEIQYEKDAKKDAEHDN